MGNIYYSTDEETFNADSIHECICDFAVGETVTIYQGESAPKSASDFVHFDSDSMTENAVDNVGEYAEGWPTTSKKEEQDLQLMVKNAVDAWADKHKKQPAFYGIRDVKEIRVKVLADGEYELQGESK